MKADEVRNLIKSDYLNLTQYDIAKTKKPELINLVLREEYRGKIQGYGLKKQRRKIVGRGASDENTDTIETKKEFNGKYIDLKN